MGKNTGRISNKIDKADAKFNKDIVANLPCIDLYTYSKLAGATKNEILLWIREHLMSSETYSRLHENTKRGRTTLAGLPTVPKMRVNVPGAQGHLYVEFYDYSNKKMVKKSLDMHIEDCSKRKDETDHFWWLNHKSWKEIFSNVLAILERQIHLRYGERATIDLHNSLSDWHSTKNKFHIGSSFTAVELKAVTLIGHTINKIKTIENSDAREVLLKLVSLGSKHNTKLKQHKRKKNP